MGDKRALCVGINTYAGNELFGTVNDANDWATTLTNAGYQATTLTDTAATRTAILDTLNGLVAQTGWGDRLVFSYSGHGTWVPDADGDEADGRDEALVPIDYQTNGLILDDDLQTVFSTRKYGAGILVLSDSCFSGTITRDLIPDAPDRRVRFLPPTLTINLNETTARELQTLPANPSRNTTSLISGSADDEYSYDAWFAGRANGAFTRAAIDAYQPGQSLAKWWSAIRATLPNDQYPQAPQLTTQSIYRRYTSAL